MDRIPATEILTDIWSAETRLCPSLFFNLSVTYVRLTRQVLRRQILSLYHFDEYYHILWRNVLDSTILMQRELSTFPLAPNYLHKLSIAGYITVDDLNDVSPTELSEGK